MLIAADGTLQRINRAGLDMIEAGSFDPGKGQVIYQLVSEEYRREFHELIEDVFKGEARKLHYKMYGLKGRPLWLYTHAVPVRNDEGKIILALATSVDVTERKQAEQEIAERQALVHQIMDTASVGIGLVDKRGRFTNANRCMAEMFGCMLEEFIGSEYADHVHPSERETSRRNMFALLASTIPSVDLQRRYIRKDCTEFWGHLACKRLHDAQGNELGLIGVITDITEQKHAEEASQQAEKRMHMAMTAARQGFFEIDIRTDDVVVSPGYVRMMGYEPDEFPQKWFNIIHPDDCETVRLIYDEYINGRRDDCRSEFRQQTRSGQWRWIFSVGTVVKWNNEGVPARMFGIYTDITERKHAEEKIRQSEQFIRKILDTVDEGFILIDRNFRIMTANRAFCNQVGELCDVIGRHCYEISHKKSRPCYEEGEECAARQVFATGQPHAVLHRHTDAKGGILYVETKAFPVTDSSGTVTSVIETLNNITERHLLEEERLKMQKLESIGTLAGGIAHDFNNLLQGVFGYISMVKVYFDQKEKAFAMLEQAEKALLISVSLTSQLLTFSKGGMPVKKRVALRPILEDSVKFALSGSRSNYTFSCDDALRMVEADEGQISQVIQNIVLNADQAMPLGGTISIAVKNVEAPAEGIPLSLTSGNYVVITISDTGIGISEQHLSKIFDPYFTTKNKGSGLGLATSYSIIKNHGGLIVVESKPGSGATFIVYLPAIEGEETKQEAPPAATAIARTGKILVMDDEEVIRNITGIMIKSLGHEVDFAANGEETLKKYREALSSGRRFDIVVLDLTIRGGKGGKETLQELLVLDPEVTTIVSSGYCEDVVVSEYRSHGFRACLVKPYEIDALKDTLNALLK